MNTLQLLLFAILATAPSVGLSSDRVEQLVDAVIRPLMAKDRLPGVAVGVTVNGQSRVFDYGEASLQTHDPVTPDTLFEVGSVSKTFTATLASYAALSGHLALPDKTSSYLPALRGSRFGDVSLLNLATHTTGGLPLQVPTNIRTNAELMQYFRVWRPTYEPGTYRTYSNLSIGLLGLITARSMRQDFTALIQQHLLVALGMRQTFVDVPAAKIPDYAEGYTTDGKPVRMDHRELSAEAYGIKSTAGDMIRYVEANMGLLGLNGSLQRAILATHTAYFKAGALTQDLIWEQYRYPVALKTLLEGNAPAMLFDAMPATELNPPEQSRADVWINKTGSTDGFSAYVAFIPEKRLGIVILANRSYPIFDRVTAGYDILTSLVQAQGATPEPPPTVVLQRIAIPGTDHQMGMGIAEFPPYTAKPRKKATGPEVIYVLSGQLTIAMDGKAPVTLHAGDSYTIPAYAIHVTSAGPAGAKVVATWVGTPGKPFNILVTARPR